jgi:hypothetical protein
MPMRRLHKIKVYDFTCVLYRIANKMYLNLNQSYCPFIINTMGATEDNIVYGGAAGA